MHGPSSITVHGATVEFVVDADADRSIKTSLLSALRPSRGRRRTVRALDGISFRIGAGERVGIIGSNGAGKTTLLRTMAGIYAPTRGDVDVRGRVCPLFEFATGFEMDASGWDNIRTRMLLLGVAPADIERSLAAVAEFTGLGDALDMPVRYYSSGMLVRLAFAASTAVEPEILLLDEVMAAGDAAFLDKASARMRGLVARASIVVFASHSLSALPGVCERTLWIDRGRLVDDGPTTTVVEHYLAAPHQASVTP